MHQEYPKLMYGRGAATRLVSDDAEQERAERDGFTAKPGDAHRTAHRADGPAAQHAAPALTEAHIPLIVEHVARALGAAPREDGAEALTVDHVPGIVEALFDRLKGMAVAASAEPGFRDVLGELHDGVTDKLEAFKGEMLAEIRAMIAPAPVVAKKA